MEQVYIINKNTFIGYEDLTVNIEDVRLKVFIKKAQDLDLKPFLGDVFFYDLLKKLVFNTDGTVKPVDTPEEYVNLINGCEYQDTQGNYMQFPGLIPALVYWSFARFVEADSIHYTATGPVTKLRDESEALKPAEITKLVQQQRSVANAHANDIVKFLEIKKSIYKFWRYSERNAQSRQPGPRIRGVDATQVRQSGYGYNGYGYPGFNNFLP